MCPPCHSGYFRQIDQWDLPAWSSRERESHSSCSCQHPWSPPTSFLFYELAFLRIAFFSVSPLIASSIPLFLLTLFFDQVVDSGRIGDGRFSSSLVYLQEIPPLRDSELAGWSQVPCKPSTSCIVSLNQPCPWGLASMLRGCHAPFFFDGI